MMTLRQVEVIRAVMVTGTIGGAARLLNVSAPGISRLVKYTEKSLGIRFFQRQNGRYFPTPEARSIFEQRLGTNVHDSTNEASMAKATAIVSGWKRNPPTPGVRATGHSTMIKASVATITGSVNSPVPSRDAWKADLPMPMCR